LIAAAQRVEHYEMAGYGSARTFAQQLGLTEAVDLLQSTLEEEEQADRKLTILAVQEINSDTLRSVASRAY
jgi:ferritin-like metal-binding protein YciE